MRIVSFHVEALKHLLNSSLSPFSPGMATIISVTILRIPDLELQHVANLLDWIFMLFPSYAMAAAITDIYSNFRSTEICKQPAFNLICSLNIAPNPCCRGECPFNLLTLLLFCKECLSVLLFCEVSFSLLLFCRTSLCMLLVCDIREI